MGQSARSCTYTLFLPQEGEIELIFALWAALSEIWADSKIAIFGHETWLSARVPELAHILSFHPRGVKSSLFSLYGQRFPKYVPIFKLPYLGMKLGYLTKCQKLHIYPLSTLRGQN